MHDDQWGAATVTLAALINVAKLKNVNPNNFKVVLSGVGAAGVATARLLHTFGVTNTLFIDSKGIINNKRNDLTKEKIELLSASDIQDIEGGLAEAIIGADVFIGLSKPNVLTEDMVHSMADKPAIFALANPNPEITPELAHASGAYVVGTGRSDYPNQINNSLVFPGAFKAMLANNIPQFKNEIFVSVAIALADLVKDLKPEKVIPGMWDEGVLETVYNAVSKTN
jgi:malate dehydrogenase (oxaloacetate-decarboxylating)